MLRQSPGDVFEQTFCHRFLRKMLHTLKKFKLTLLKRKHVLLVVIPRYSAHRHTPANQVRVAASA